MAAMTANGTTRTYRHVCYLAAFGGKAGISQRIAERDLLRQTLAAENDMCVVPDVQAIFCRRRHQPRRPSLS
jgi:hypothetical protein